MQSPIARIQAVSTSVTVGLRTVQFQSNGHKCVDCVNACKQWPQGKRRGQCCTISLSLTANVLASYPPSFILTMNSSKVCGISNLPFSSSLPSGSSKVWYITSGTYEKVMSFSATNRKSSKIIEKFNKMVIFFNFQLIRRVKRLQLIQVVYPKSLALIFFLDNLQIYLDVNQNIIYKPI